MRKFIIFAILCLGSWIAFAQVDVVQSEYYQVKVGDSLISQHSQQYQAIEKLLNLKMQRIEDAYVLPPAMTVNYEFPIIDECVSDTIYMPSDSIRYVDFIQVDGKDYKVSEIEFMLPKEEVDTIFLAPCFDEVEKKQWFHVGDTQVYPHRIWFPTKNNEFVAVMFSDSLTLDMKRYQTEFKVERRKNHLEAKIYYRNLYVDPETYLPTN